MKTKNRSRVRRPVPLRRPSWFRVPARPQFIKRTAAGKRYFVLPVPSKRQLLKAALVVIGTVAVCWIGTTIYRYVGPHSYRVSSADILLSRVDATVAKMLKYDAAAKAYTFSHGLAASGETASTSASQIKATIPTDASKGVSVTDPLYQATFTMTPTTATVTGKQEDNRVVYPIRGQNGWIVYTPQSTGIKEDIVLEKAGADTQEFSYTLGLPAGTDAKLEKDGSVGIYGSAVFLNSITPATSADASLLEKARANAPKDTLIFSIPKPTIVESGNATSSVKAAYSLNGSKLTVRASNLAHASYPLSIDPSIYVVTAQQFMNGNNETNIDFDVPNKVIKKAETTGARFNTWQPTQSMNSTIWQQGVAVASGYIYTAGGVHPNGGQTIYTTAGTDSFVVPSGITSITVKMWGAGGGGGGGGNASAGGAGGAGGYATSTLTVSPGETLSLAIGGGGDGGVGSTNSGAGGGGGGYSAVRRSTTPLLVAAGGAGGGGGGRNSGNVGGAGGGGGGSTGANGSASGTSGGGSGGTQSGGGAAGTGSTNYGTAGSSFQGGAGGDGRSSQGSDGGANNGGTSGGGAGGANDIKSRYAGAGGGGGGYYGGGGGTGSTSNTGAGGGGGGSSYLTGSGSSTAAASGTTPGNSSDSDRSAAATSGGGGATRGAGGVGSNGIILISYSGTDTTNSTVSWAHFNTTNGTIESTNPGNGTCSGWCSSSQYNLPTSLAKFSLVAYNGFLYALGGQDVSCVAGNATGDSGICKTVYVAKLGANGEPQLWHPTDSNKSNWSYWYRAGDLPSPRSAIKVVAYNSRLYLLGGTTSSGGTTSVSNAAQVADITPNGTLSAWSATTSLPTSLTGYTAQAYNDRLYVVGGATSATGSPTAAVYYNKINPDGTLNSWVPTTTLATARMSNGGDFGAIWGGYLYVSGGCNATNSSGYCTSISSDTQVASINADGSLDAWNSVGGVSDTRTGQSLVSWRGTLYEVGGCAVQSTTTGACTNALSDIQYGTINQDGDASTVGQTVPSGTAPCTGASASGCNLPGTAYIGNMLTVSFISNGYLYLVGGCTDNTCSATQSNSAYTAISSTGTMVAPATCPTPRTLQGGMWCVDTTNVTPGGVAAASPVVFNGRVYLVGGLNGSANTNDLLRADINQTDGSLSAWTNQTLTGLGMNNVSYSYAFSRANPTDATNNPGNLYLFGGCATSSNAGCTAYSRNVYKCNIQATGAIAGCSTSGQQQIDNTGDTATGLGIMSGTVYANYVYLIGGVTPNLVDLKTVHYAKIDDNNNIVSVNGNGWIESPYQMAVGRRRSAAFGYNGYLYAVGGYEAVTGVLADIEFIKINVSDGSLTGGWNVSAVEINQRWGLTVPVSNSYAYVIGGCTVGASPGGCTSRTDVIQTFQVYNNDSGTPAGYTNATSYTTNQNRLGSSSVVLGGRLYAAGGCTGTTDCTTPVATVSSAPLDANGTVGAWTDQAALPAPRGWGKLVSVGGTLYYIGGQDAAGTPQSTIYYATPAGATLSTWATSTNGLPSARSKFGATTWNNRLYVVGGQGSGSGCTGSNVCSTIYVSPQLNSGGTIGSAWSTASTNLPVARSGVAAIAYANNLYAFGGFDGANYLSDTQFSQISTATGTSGDWSYTTSLPKPLANADAVAANGYIYLVGGRDTTTTCAPSTLLAPVSANTTIATGNTPTGVGEWYATNQRFSGARYGAAAAYSEGKLYVLGGGCGSTIAYPTPATTVQQTSLLSQPQVAKYSIMMDTDTDVFPNYWLMNGVDNSIGASWQLNYRSMANQLTATKCAPMSTWGQPTYAAVTLGTPSSYIVKNASGTDISCGRYFFFNVSVDSSQAYGYPDDVTRGPTISDLTLQFTADPSKRLMHGRTFTGGLQMPDDTPLYSR